MQLPVADAQLIAGIEQELRGLGREADQEATTSARCRYAWALVHSDDERKVRQGAKLCQSMVREGEGEARELLYLLAVAQYKQRKYLDARKTLAQLLQVAPNTHQAQVLKEAVDSAVVQEGLVGVGIGAAVVGVVGAVVTAAVMGSRK